MNVWDGETSLRSDGVIPPNNFAISLEIPLKMIVLVRGDTVNGGALNHTKNDGALQFISHLVARLEEIAVLHK